MSQETEISRDFLINETIFSEDKTNANIMKKQAKTLFGTEEEINKSWLRQVSTNFIKKWQDCNPDAEFFTNERSVNEEKTNEKAFDEYDSINDEKFMKNQPKSKEESYVNIIKVDPMKGIPDQNYCFKQSLKQSLNLLNIQSSVEDTSSKSTVISQIEDDMVITQQHKKEFFEAIHEQEKLHICSECGDGFGEKSALKRHIGLVHEKKKNISINGAKCPRCDKYFVDKGNILKHIKAVHEKIKPYKCLVCNKGFPEKTQMTIHIEAVHEGKKPHICNICGIGYGTKSYLNRHVRSVHEGQKPDPKKQRKCSICNKIFPHQGNLSRHIRAVHEGKKFSCVMCEASFWENNGLKKHVALTHEQRVPLVCSICSAPYILKSTLEKHFARCVFQEQQRKKQIEQAY